MSDVVLLDQLETSFGLLTRGPQPLSVDGREIGCGLPARAVGLDELRRLLAAPALPLCARDAALRLLVVRARSERGAALIGLVGVLLPRLRGAVAPLLVDVERAHGADLEAEVLAGLMAVVDTVCLDGPDVAGRLVGQAAQAGARLLARLQAIRSWEGAAGGVPAGLRTWQRPWPVP